MQYTTGRATSAIRFHGIKLLRSISLPRWLPPVRNRPLRLRPRLAPPFGRLPSPYLASRPSFPSRWTSRPATISLGVDSLRSPSRSMLLTNIAEPVATTHHSWCLPRSHVLLPLLRQILSHRSHPLHHQPRLHHRQFRPYRQLLSFHHQPCMCHRSLMHTL